ncbi:MAG: hypothetical protein NW205_06045 [Hyphomicrobiaceae bacterium]|nr:hypothetical protein [Hyphomicrobiaceae bacterium]
MLRLLTVMTALLVASLVASPPAATAPDLAASPRQAPTRELVVLEMPGCIYCGIFRRDVLPAYKASLRAGELPIRFIDINDRAAGDIGLAAPVDIIPTFVILENNEELGRIPGYVGPETFFHAVNHILSRR